LTPDKTGKLQFGSKISNFVADRTQPLGLATVAYDDEGIAGQKWHLVKDGTFVDWQTTRDLAPLIGKKSSYGCLHADSWGSVPFPRMPNVSLEPAKENVSQDDLIAGVEKGILIYGRGSYSIDQQRYNFQFGGQTFWEIKNGKVRGMLRRCRVSIAHDRFLGRVRRARRSGDLFDSRQFQRRQRRTRTIECRFARLPVSAFRNIDVLNTAAQPQS
jgi:predicted Zn-dependent protease